nr:type I 3-dehydroquinate dehydratase [Nitrospinota bacterium]
MPKALEQITAAEKIADILELRLDLINSFDLNALLKAATKPVIVTNRSKLDGGQFKGGDEERVRALHDALEAGADYVDIEVSTAREHLQPFLEGHETSRIIISYHDFSHTTEDINPLYEAMNELPGGVIKIVTY